MPRIELTDNHFQINEIRFQFPIDVDNLNKVLGKCRKTHTKYNEIYTWDNHGLLAFSKKGKYVESILICLSFDEYEFSPKQLFDGQITINNEDAVGYYKQNKENRTKLFKGDKGGAIVLNGISFWFDVKNQTVEAIEIQKHEKPLEADIPALLLVDEKYKYLQPLWTEWIEEIEMIIPTDNDYFNLTHGITEDDINNYVLLSHDIVIPNELINFYKVFNVENNSVASAFSFSVNRWDYDLIPFEKIKAEWEGIQDLLFGDDIEANLLNEYSEKVKADDYANPKWIPFATGRNGDYLLYDTDPGYQGTYGQIIELQNESWERNVVSKSLTALVQNEIGLLKNGQIGKFDFILGKKK